MLSSLAYDTQDVEEVEEEEEGMQSSRNIQSVNPNNGMDIYFVDVNLPILPASTPNTATPATATTTATAITRAITSALVARPRVINSLASTSASPSSSSSSSPFSYFSSRPLTTVNSNNPTSHPQFKSKVVLSLSCQSCSHGICDRGMRSPVGLAYSTDLHPFGVDVVEREYDSKDCKCRLRDSACLGCGSVIGYHIIAPACSRCLSQSANKNGHFWIFHADSVKSVELFARSGEKLRWSGICLEPRLEPSSTKSTGDLAGR